jgi:hypothetical protein
LYHSYYCPFFQLFQIRSKWQASQIDLAFIDDNFFKNHPKFSTNRNKVAKNFWGYQKVLQKPKFPSIFGLKIEHQLKIL